MGPLLLSDKDGEPTRKGLVKLMTAAAVWHRTTSQGQELIEAVRQ